MHHSHQSRAASRSQAPRGRDRIARVANPEVISVAILTRAFRSADSTTCARAEPHNRSSAPLRQPLTGLEITSDAGIITPFELRHNSLLAKPLRKDAGIIGPHHRGTPWPSTFADIVEYACISLCAVQDVTISPKSSKTRLCARLGRTPERVDAGRARSGTQARGEPRLPTPEHFGILCVGCAKARSKIMLADFLPAIITYSHGIS